MQLAMKQIARAIRRALDRNDMSQLALSEMAGLDNSTISRLLNTTLRVSNETLDAVLMAFPDAADRFDIVQAHIHDEVSPAAREAVNITPSDKARVKRKTLHPGSLTTTGEEALRYLLEHPNAVEDIFIDLAKVLGWKARTGQRGTIKRPQSKTIVTV